MQTAVAVDRPGLVLLTPNSGRRFRRIIIIHTAAHGPRISTRRVLAEQPGKTHAFGLQVGAQALANGSNKVYHCIRTHGRGANPSVRTHVSGSNPFSSSYRSGRDSCCCDNDFMKATDHSVNKFQNINNNKTHTNSKKLFPLTQKTSLKTQTPTKQQKQQQKRKMTSGARIPDVMCLAGFLRLLLLSV